MPTIKGTNRRNFIFPSFPSVDLELKLIQISASIHRPATATTGAFFWPGSSSLLACRQLFHEMRYRFATKPQS